MLNCTSCGVLDYKTLWCTDARLVWVILLRLSLVLSNNRTYHSKMASRLVSFFRTVALQEQGRGFDSWRPLELHVLTSPALMNNFYLFSPSNVPTFSLLWTCNTTLQGHQPSLIYGLRTVNCLGICKWVFTLFAHIPLWGTLMEGHVGYVVE